VLAGATLIGHRARSGRSLEPDDALSSDIDWWRPGELNRRPDVETTTGKVLDSPVTSDASEDLRLLLHAKQGLGLKTVRNVYRRFAPGHVSGCR
jgi:hypothetical protein